MNRNIPTITKKEYQYLCKQTLFTGSRCFGGHTKKSDFDFVLTYEQYKNNFPSIIKFYNINTNRNTDCGIQYIETEHYTEDATNFASLRCLYTHKNYGEISVNLIVVTDDVLLEAWEFTTSVFYNTLDKFKNIITDKTIRKTLFQDIKLSYLKHKLLLDGRIEDAKKLRNS